MIESCVFKIYLELLSQQKHLFIWNRVSVYIQGFIKYVIV